MEIVGAGEYFHAGYGCVLEFYMSNEKVYKMEFSKIYPLLVNKAVKKGRSKEEVDEVICWLTGYYPEDRTDG